MYLEISNPVDYHAALYIRLSKEDKNEGPFESVNNQQSLLNEFVHLHRLGVYDTYIDEAVTGTSAKKRRDFQRIITWCKKGKIDLIITKSISRFARNTLDCLYYVRYLQQLGIPDFFKHWLGCKKDTDGEPEIIPEEAAVVRRIFARSI